MVMVIYLRGGGCLADINYMVVYTIRCLSGLVLRCCFFIAVLHGELPRILDLGMSLERASELLA